MATVIRMGVAIQRIFARGTPGAPPTPPTNPGLLSFPGIAGDGFLSFPGIAGDGFLVFPGVN